MKIIEPSFEVITPIEGEYGRNMLRVLELAGRTCYKSEGKITCDSHSGFISKLANVYKHESVLEHASVTVKFVCDRGVSHELVRHRLASYSQESTRYCNYSADKFGSEITVIRPPFWSAFDTQYTAWYSAMKVCEAVYKQLLDAGASPQEARSVLPNSLKTEIVVTANLREWMHIFRMRCSSKAHPQMVQSMMPVFEHFKLHLPELFANLEIK